MNKALVLIAIAFAVAGCVEQPQAPIESAVGASATPTASMTATATVTPSATSKPSLTPSESATPAPADEFVEWIPMNGEWIARSTPPECPPLELQSPVDVNLATSILYPGQNRPDYKPHGGFRFDNAPNNDIQVVLPQDSYISRGARYLVNGEIQYAFDFFTPCGMMHRLGHLRELTPEFQAIADALPEPKELDSRTSTITPKKYKAGTVIATAVGVRATKNVFMDWGMYDLRKKNAAASNSQWLSEHSGELAPHALCWLHLLQEPDQSIVKALPGADGKAGKQSDYC